MKAVKIYESPVAEIVDLCAEDILTFSAGFDGEDHEFELPMP